MKDTVLKLDSVTFGYQEGDTLLKDIDLEISRGDYVGIVGANGSAKSTLLKLMVGVIRPQAGQVYIKGVPIDEFKDWGSVGYLSQQVRSFNSNFPATVEEVVGANLYSKKGILKILDRRDKERIREALRVVEMESYSSRMIGSLSGGQQQRVFIARLLVSDPDIILMDEPLVGVDSKSRAHFYEIIEELNKNMGITCIMVTHDLGEIFKKSDRVLVLEEKRIKESDVRLCTTEGERLKVLERDIKI